MDMILIMENNYWGYNPFYYNSWYSPFIFSFNFGNRWRNNYYGWNGYSQTMIAMITE
jgi:hypothetical protein